MFDVKQFYEDYNIDYYEGDYPHKHCRPGWINTECPRCSGNPGYHLGFSENSGQFVCWRCGFMPIIEAVRKLANVSWPEAIKIAKKFGGEKTYKRYEKAPKEKDIDVLFPAGTLDYFPKKHRRYLENKNFDPDYLIDSWNLRATGTLGTYKNRIIAPIYYKNKFMSYQARTIFGEVEPRYKACEMENERRHHKYCLYGLDLVAGKSVLVVEGISDVWRMGIGSVATFGIKYTDVQILLLTKHFDNIFILFDPQEEAAQIQAKKLTRELAAMGKEAETIVYDSDCDPGSLSNKDARYIMRELLIK